MEETKKYNFKIIFDKIEEFNKDNADKQCIDNQIIEQIDNDIELIRIITEEINESQYYTYSGT